MGLALAAGVWLAMLVACPATHSHPCDSDAECPQGRCREGGCGPQCFQDFECAAGESCQAGSCSSLPQCAQTPDCATGFQCVQGQCLCSKDSACAANQACLEGKCGPQPTCTSDAQCAPYDRHCDLAQGVCVAPCDQPSDCAPQLDPNLATTLYTCVNGVCEQRCLGDNTCLSAGQVCINGGCAQPDCKTFTDCPQGQYCTSATLGQCLAYQVCQSTAQCPANFQCQPFNSSSCPPGFPCSTEICQELPRCFIDADCSSSAPSYCADGHCQPSAACLDSSTCEAGTLCIAGTCVPGGCRGLVDCPPNEECVDGICQSAPLSTAVQSLAITPRAAVMAVGDSLQLKLIAYNTLGASFPLSSATFTVTDALGHSSTAATVDGEGRVTAAAAGTVRVQGSMAGSSAPAVAAQIMIYTASVTGRRIIILDAATRVPLPNVSVLACDSPPLSGPCPAPVSQTTDSLGTASFAFVGSSWTVSVAAPNVREDGMPTYDRASVVATDANTVLLPLEANPVHGAAGFTGAIDFSNVHTQGALQLGFGLLSVGDPLDLDLQTLFGQTFTETVPGTSQQVALPGSAIVQLELPFGAAVAIKSTIDGLGQAGLRTVSGFGGNFDPQLLNTLGSTDVLAYAGAMDFALSPFLVTGQRPFVAGPPDAGLSDVPDYSSFPSIAFSPHRAQQERTEVVLPDLPVGLDTAIIAAIAASSENGLSFVGLSSRNGGAAQADGTRPLGTLVLQSGPPYGGVEASEPGVWVFGVAPGGQGFSSTGRTVSGRCVRSPVLPSRLVVGPFLPLPAGSTYSSASRTIGLPQPQWNALGSAGASLARAVLTGTSSRHVVYWSLDGAQSALRVPESPLAAGADPASSAGTSWDVTAIQLAPGITARDALDLPSPNLTDLPTIVDAYARSGP